MNETTLLRQIMEIDGELEKLKNAQENLGRFEQPGEEVQSKINIINNRVTQLDERKRRLKELVGPITSLPSESDTIFEKEFLYD